MQWTPQHSGWFLAQSNRKHFLYVFSLIPFWWRFFKQGLAEPGLCCFYSGTESNWFLKVRPVLDAGFFPFSYFSYYSALPAGTVYTKSSHCWLCGHSCQKRGVSLAKSAILNMIYAIYKDKRWAGQVRIGPQPRANTSLAVYVYLCVCVFHYVPVCHRSWVGCLFTLRWCIYGTCWM